MVFLTSVTKLFAYGTRAARHLGTMLPATRRISAANNAVQKVSPPKILALLGLLLLSACDDYCIAGNDFVEIIKGSSIVHGNAAPMSEPDGSGTYQSGWSANLGKWIDSGIYADGSNKLDISVNGTIATCGINSTNSYVVDSRNSAWTNTSTTVSPGDKVTIRVGAPNLVGCSASSDKTCTLASCKNVWDYGNKSSQSCKVNGYSLSGMIGTTGPYALEVGSMGFPGWGTNIAADVPNGGFSGILSNLVSAGNVSLRIGDSADGYGDNSGGFLVTISRTQFQPPPSCVFRNGANLDVLVVNSEASPTSRTGGTLLPLVGGTYSGVATKGKIWLRVHDGSDTNADYIDNSGYYYVNVQKTMLANHNTSSIINTVVQPVQDMLSTISRSIYNSIVTDRYYKRIVKAVLLLYIILYALFFSLGLIKHRQIDLVVRCFKVGVLLMLISDQSWNFFNNYLFSAFTDGSRFLINAATGAYGDTSNPFLFLDATIGQFFTTPTWNKLGALILSFPMGTIYFGVIVAAFALYIFAVIEAVISYMLSLIALSVMIIMAPIFLIFMMFSTTRSMFDDWISHIFNFALQPVLLFAALVLFNEFMAAAFYQAVSFGICWTCVFEPVIPTSQIPGIGSTIGDISLGCWMMYWLPNGFSFGEIWSPVGLFASIMMLLIISDATRKFVEVCPDIVAMLTGAGGGGDRLPLSTGAVMDKLQAATKGIAKLAIGTDQRSKDRKRSEAAARSKGGNDGTVRGSANAPAPVASQSHDAYDEGKLLEKRGQDLAGSRQDLDARKADVAGKRSAHDARGAELGAKGSALASKRAGFDKEQAKLDTQEAELGAAPDESADDATKDKHAKAMNKLNIGKMLQKRQGATLEKEEGAHQKDQEEWDEEGSGLDKEEEGIGQEEAQLAQDEETHGTESTAYAERQETASIAKDQGRLNQSGANLNARKQAHAQQKGKHDAALTSHARKEQSLKTRETGNKLGREELAGKLAENDKKGKALKGQEAALRKERDQLKEPQKPKDLPKNASESQKKDHAQKMKAYKADKETYDTAKTAINGNLDKCKKKQKDVAKERDELQKHVRHNEQERQGLVTERNGHTAEKWKLAGEANAIGIEQHVLAAQTFAHHTAQKELDVRKETLRLAAEERDIPKEAGRLEQQRKQLGAREGELDARSERVATEQAALDKESAPTRDRQAAIMQERTELDQEKAGLAKERERLKEEGGQVQEMVAYSGIPEDDKKMMQERHKKDMDALSQKETSNTNRSSALAVSEKVNQEAMKPFVERQTALDGEHARVAQDREQLTADQSQHTKERAALDTRQEALPMAHARNDLEKEGIDIAKERIELTARVGQQQQSEKVLETERQDLIRTQQRVEDGANSIAGREGELAHRGELLEFRKEALDEKGDTLSQERRDMVQEQRDYEAHSSTLAGPEKEQFERTEGPKLLDKMNALDERHQEWEKERTELARDMKEFGADSERLEVDKGNHAVLVETAQAKAESYSEHRATVVENGEALTGAMQENSDRYQQYVEKQQAFDESGSAAVSGSSDVAGSGSAGGMRGEDEAPSTPVQSRGSDEGDDASPKLTRGKGSRNLDEGGPEGIET